MSARAPAASSSASTTDWLDISTQIVHDTGSLRCPNNFCDAGPKNASRVNGVNRSWAAQLQCSNNECKYSQSSYYYVCRVCPLSSGCRKIIFSSQSELGGHKKTAGHKSKMEESSIVLRDRNNEMDVDVDQETTTGLAGGSEAMSATASIQAEDQVTSPQAPIENDYEDEDGDFEMCSGGHDDYGNDHGEQQHDQQEPASATGPRTVSKQEFIQDLIKGLDGVEQRDFYNLFPSPDGGTDGEYNYFLFQQFGQKGPEYLVAKAFFDGIDGKEWKDAIPSIDKTDTLWAFLISWLGEQLSERQRKVLWVILDHARNFQVKDNAKRIPIPSTPAKFSKMFTKTLPEMVPTPTIQRVDDHIYVSLIDLIRLQLGHGSDMEPLHERSSFVHAHCPRGKELLAASKEASSGDDERITVVIALYTWRDAFDINRTKNNRISLWVMLVSIGTPADDIHSACNTYIVALGPKSSKHDRVEELFRQDLETLAGDPRYNVFYHGGWEKKVNLNAFVFCELQDRPEKADSTRLVTHMGTHLKCFGYSGNYKAVKDKFRACEKCDAKRRKRVMRQVDDSDSADSNETTECPDCFDWNLSKARFAVPQNYPESELLDPEASPEGQTLPFKKVLYADLKAACELTVDKLVKRSWTKTQANVFLESKGFPKSFIEIIQNSAQTLIDDPNADISYLPATWLLPLVELCELVPAIMHQLFLGVEAASNKEIIFPWLGSNAKRSDCIRRIEPILKFLRKMSLTWLKAMPIGSKATFGAYVSENHLAYSRLQKWFAGMIDDLEKTDIAADYSDQPKEKPVTTYNKNQCRGWLKARDFPVSGNLGVLQKRILEIISAEEEATGIPGSWPIRIDDPAYQSTIAAADDIAEMSIWLHTMISQIMSFDGSRMPTDAEVDHIEDVIKIFLSTVHKVDAPRLEKNKDRNILPEWLSKANFVTLLAIPEAMRRYGPPRILWEGSSWGEGLIPEIKRSVKSKQGPNIAFNAARNFYIKRGIRSTLRTLLRDHPTLSNEEMLRVVKSIVVNQYFKTELLSTNANKSDTDVDEIVDEILAEEQDDNEEPELREEEPTATESSSSNEKMYQVYDSGVAREEFEGEDHMPVSMVIFDNQERTCAVLTKGNCMIPLVRLDYTGTSCGAAYFQWKMGEEAERPSSKIKHYCILLPFLGRKVQDREGNKLEPTCRVDYLITSNWTELQENGKLGLAHWLDAP